MNFDSLEKRNDHRTSRSLVLDLLLIIESASPFKHAIKLAPDCNITVYNFACSSPAVQQPLEKSMPIKKTF